jgi:hypothetical protein
MYFCGQTEESHENCQDSQWPGRHSIRLHPEYVSGVTASFLIVGDAKEIIWKYSAGNSSKTPSLIICSLHDYY